MEKRVLVSDVQPGDFVIKVGKHEINARFVEMIPCLPGQRVRGPRGGAYELTAAGAQEYCTFVCGTKKPLVDTGTVAVILISDF
jgi:hypothetical protein